MAGEIPVSNIINVSITSTPLGLTENNVNNIAFLTTDAPVNPGIFGVSQKYISASQVAEDFASASETVKMANAFFGQTPNIRSGNGVLNIVPMVAAVSGTVGSVTTPNILANLATLQGVTNGDIKFTINGTVYNLLALNFTGAASLADIAGILQSKLPAGVVTATTNAIVIASKKIGTGSTVVAAAGTGGSGVALTGATYLNTAGGTTVTGAASTGETLVAAITRTEGTIAYSGVFTNLDMDDATVLSTASAIQSRDMIFFHHGGSQDDIAGLATSVTAAGNKKTRILVYSLGPDLANIAKAAAVGRAFSVNFSGSNTSQTLNLKQLAGILPDPNMTQTLYLNAQTAGADIYVSIDGVPSYISNGANDYFDNVYADLALKFALQAAGFNYLRQTNTKVPQTEPGMNGLKNAYIQVMDRFVRNASFAPGSWTSSEKFGDPAIFDENITNRGYYVYSLPVAQQSPVERNQRKAPLIQIAGKRAGAIHTSDVQVNINN